MAFTDQERTVMLESSTTTSPSAPSFSHWYIITGPCSKATVDKITLGALQRLWHPSFNMLRDPAHPPRYRPPHLLLPPRLWRDFWSLCLPAKAFTPWWRLLHGHLSVQARLHSINVVKYPSPLCKVCQEAPEDEYHMVIGCSSKSLFWYEVASHLGLTPKFPTDAAIWLGLTTLHGQDNHPLDISILELLGAAFSCVWQHHWGCTLDGKSWLTRAVFSSFLADNAKLISSFVDM
ncbi:RNA polymerase II subunit 3 [Mucor velutinosus]|uniref:RNA polymerase II subunit 3 n=1 Tax=Mucor velutinosus TaxID=708070 RepID=A0AAN7D3I0_9FUNG|nr:RNA polymerase II subunit 3 [Mucor velutinosus]